MAHRTALVSRFLRRQLKLQDRENGVSASHGVPVYRPANAGSKLCPWSQRYVCMSGLSNTILDSVVHKNQACSSRRVYKKWFLKSSTS